MPGKSPTKPYVGWGSAAAAAATLKRKFLGAELNRAFYAIALQHLKLLLSANYGIALTAFQFISAYQTPH
jgi:hypothetical protein